MENTNPKPEVKLPIAAILEVFIALGTIITQTAFQISQLHNGGYNAFFVIELLLSVIAPIMLCILLFMRKRSGVLTIPFFIFILLAVKNMRVGFLVGRPDLMATIISQNALLILEDVLIIVFIFAMYHKPEGGLARFSKAIWFIPGILGVLSAILNFIYRCATLGYSYGFDVDAVMVASLILNSIGMFFGAALDTAFLLLLGWWITHPFKKPRPVQNYAPYNPAAPNPYAQPSAYCPACGAPIAPGTAFCSKCGKSVNEN